VAISDITLAPGVSRIVIDNHHAVRLALVHLKELGHQRIAFFKGPEGNGDTEARWAATQSAAAEMGIPVSPELTATMGTYFAAGKVSMMQRGYDAAMMLTQKTRNFTALLAFNDGSAIGAIRAFQDLGWTVPEQISVMGTDDIPLAAFISPRLTTVRQPLKVMGGMAASTLLQRIEGIEVAEETVVEPELVVRESTGRRSA